MIVKRIPRRPPDGRGKAGAVGALCRYILAGGADDPADKLIVGGALNALGKSERGWITEMQALAVACTRSPNPVVHYVLSWRPGEHPTNAQIEQAVEIFSADMGYANNLVVWGAHGNTDNIHVHLAVNRYNDTLGRAVRPYRGFDHDLALRAIARIESEQGWQPEAGARFRMEDGHIVRIERGKGRASPPHEPGIGDRTGDNVTSAQDRASPTPHSVDAHVPAISYRARGAEIRSGKKSTQRVAQEAGVGETIARARDWEELHALLAYGHSASYLPKGGGAVIVMGGRTVKASSVDYRASLSKLEQRLGPYQAPHASTAPLIAKAAQEPRAPKPVSDEATEYAAAREAYNEAKRVARAALDASIAERETTLKAAQEDERAEIAGRSWKGRGAAMNAIRAAMGARHAEQRAALKQQTDAERKAFRTEHSDWPDFATWKAAKRAEGNNFTIDEEQEQKQHVYFTHAPTEPHAGRARRLSENRVRRLSERRLARRDQRDGPDVRCASGLLQSDARIDRRATEDVRRRHAGGDEMTDGIDPIQRKIDAALTETGVAPARDWTVAEINKRIAVLVNDMDDDGCGRLFDDGYRPAAIHETAPRRWRATILVARRGADGEDEAARIFERRLNERYASVRSISESFEAPRVVAVIRTLCAKASTEIAGIVAALRERLAAHKDGDDGREGGADAALPEPLRDYTDTEIGVEGVEDSFDVFEDGRRRDGPEI